MDFFQWVYTKKRREFKKNQINQIVEFTFGGADDCVTGCEGTTFSIDVRGD